MIAETTELAGDSDVRERALKGFSGEVRSLRPSLGYRMALVAVAFAMVLLPVVYISLVLMTVWMLWSYSRFFVVTLLPALNDVSQIPFELLPLLVGLPVLGALIRPLFFRLAQPSPQVRIDPTQEPLLFELVARVCAVLGAPVPNEIHVNCEANAFAEYRGLKLPSFRRDLVLGIGLPLIERLSLQQLAGIMAHELGHFSQRAGGYASRLIQEINVRLIRLTYHRDRFEIAFERHLRRSKNLVWRLGLRIALFPVQCTRWILWVLTMIGRTLSAHFMREKEYDADRYEVRLAGFSAFDFSHREMGYLQAAHRIAMGRLREQWKEGRLVNNFPRLVAADRKQAARAIEQQVERQLANQTAGRFSTHPTVRQRTARALREKGVGVFSSDLPATALFSHLEELEERATLAFYRQQVGNQVKTEDLLVVDDLKAREAQRESERAALNRVFQNPSLLKGVSLPPALPPTPADPAAAAAELAATRSALAVRNEPQALAGQQYHAAAGERLVALQAYAVLDAGFTLRPGQFNLAEGRLSLAHRAAANAEERMQSLSEELAGFEAPEVRRLLLALSLLAPREAAEARQLLACAAFVSTRLPLLYRLRESGAALEILRRQIKPDRTNPRLADAIRDRHAGLSGQLKELHRSLRGQMYPFDHARQEVTLAQFALPAMPADADDGRLVGAAEHAAQRLYELYDRLLGRLAWLAEQAESGLASAGAPGAAAAAVSPLAPRAVSPGEPESPAAQAELAPIQESKADVVESRERFALYFRHLLPFRPVPLPRRLPEAGPQTAAELAETCQAVTATVAGYAERARKYEAAQRQYLRAESAGKLLEAGLSPPPADGSPSPNPESVVQDRERALAAMNALEPGLRAFEELQGRRLAAALSLLHSASLPLAAAEAGRFRGETPQLLACVQTLQDHMPVLHELRRHLVVLQGIGEQQARGAKNPRLGPVIAEQVLQVHKHLQGLQRALHDRPCPFAGSDRQLDLSRRIVPSLPRQEEVSHVFRAAAYALKEMLDLHQRALGRMAGAAEEVERTLPG